MMRRVGGLSLFYRRDFMAKKSILKKQIKTFIVSGLAAILSVSGVVSYPVFAKGNIDVTAEPGIQGEYVPGDVIICIQPERADEYEIAAKSAGLFSAPPEIESGFLMDVSKAAESISEESGDTKLQVDGNEQTVLKLIHSDDLTTEELIKLYSNKPGVVFAEPNYIRQTAETDPPIMGKSDPDKEDTPDVTKDQYAFGNGKGGIDVPNWNNSAIKNADGIVVAVLDSGVDYDNEDLAPVMWKDGLKYKELKDLGGGEYGFNAGYDDYKRFQEQGEEGYENLTDKSNPKDTQGHGTHCSGIIAAAWNGKGVSGAVNGAEIMAVKIAVSDSGATLTSAMAKGYHYINTAKLAGVNVRAMNVSYGGPLEDYVDAYAARELGENGVVVCYASGNDTEDNDIVPGLATPFNIPSRIIVNSNDIDGEISSYSNYGKRSTHIFSPGSMIMSTIPNTQKKAYPDSNISGAVSVNGYRFYDDFSSVSTNFTYTPNSANGTKISIEDNELKISGTDISSNDDEITTETVSEEDTDRVVAFTMKTKELPEGGKYQLVFKRRVKDEGTWNLMVYMKTVNGNWERPAATPSIRQAMEPDSYFLDKSMNGNAFNLKDPEIRFVLRNPAEEKPVLQEVAIGELWITDTAGYPYAYMSGTSMATPAVTGEAAILAKAYPYDSAEKLAARVLAGVRTDAKFSDLCVTGGMANVRNSLNEDSYTPVVNDITADKDGLHIRGFFFGSKEKTEVILEQGKEVFTTADSSLSIKKIDDKGEEILLSIPDKLERMTEVNVTVKDSGKKEGRQTFSRILTVNDPDSVLKESGSLYKRIPIPEDVLNSIKKTIFYDAYALKGSFFFNGVNDYDDGVGKMETVAWRFKDGQWTKMDSAPEASGHMAVYDGKLVYTDMKDAKKLVFYDENGGKEVLDTRLDLSAKGELYYDGKDLIVISVDKDEEKDYISRVYRLDPKTGNVTVIGVLNNIYTQGVVIAHEEREGQPNRIYIIGKGYEMSGEDIKQSDFIAERFTVDDFKPENLNAATPEGYEFPIDISTWTGFGVKDGIYIAGAQTVDTAEKGLHHKTADNYFFSFSDPDSGFKNADRMISDSYLNFVAAGAAYNKAYFLSMAREGYILSCADMEMLPLYGEESYSDPASALHRTTGEDIGKIGPEYAKYPVFDPQVNTTVIAFTKADVTKAFSSLPEYDESAKHRYISDDKKIAKINKKGILKAKNRGEVNITCEQKVKGGSWQKLGEGLHIFVQLPEMTKKEEAAANSTGLNAYNFLSKTSYSPTAWKSSNEKVATVNEKGDITILKAGKTNIIAEYDEGKNCSKKKFKTKLVIK